MGYSHTFYAVDLRQLRAIPASRDLTIYQQLKAKEDPPDDGELKALHEIILGDCNPEPYCEFEYGYALKALCAHIGERVGGEDASIEDHPYESKLIANGPPISIPYDANDFPQVGYLDHREIAAEYTLATETKPKAKRTLIGFILRTISGGSLGREMSNKDVADDMAAYAQALKDCMDREMSIVSFRH